MSDRSKCQEDFGATAIEFGLLAPILLIVVTAILEYSLMALSQTQLHSALANLARLGKTGQLSAVNSQAAAAPLVVSYMTLPFYTPAQLSVCTQVNVPNAAALVPCTGTSPFNPGTPGDIVVYSALYQWQGITPVWSLLHASTTATVTLGAGIVVKNETFPQTTR